MYETVGEVYRKTTADFLLSKTVLAERVGVGQPLSKNNEGGGGGGRHTDSQTVELTSPHNSKNGNERGCHRHGHKIKVSVFIWNSSLPDGSMISPVRWMEEEVGEMEEERSVPGNSCPCNLYWWGDRHGRELPAVWSLRQSRELVGGAAHPCGSGWTWRTFWTHTHTHAGALKYLSPENRNRSAHWPCRMAWSPSSLNQQAGKKRPSLQISSDH